ncbi:PDC sensor domain-containing protein [sulfur-oxidizing endosymbiont of Gigantopelta aegis]|uniref:PDC sensor domain-containing protein n=1 Tax=sulfur-oxidizing endosymbiont of Gigantopelta aegis TaxID=2794934 RepID=UPI001BE3EA61|nr:hypothetical protein [sulfur-oxidizing endosymbiont of Gigantopelta aegis]
MAVPLPLLVIRTTTMNYLLPMHAYRTSGRVNTLDIADITDYTAGHWQWWDKAKQAKHPIWTDPYFDKGVGDIVMATYAVPFFYKKQFRGIATVDVQLEILEEKVNQGIDVDLDLLIITNKGDYVYHPDPKQILANSIYKDAKKYHQNGLKDLADKMIAGKRGVVQLDSWETQQKQWVAFYPIQNTEWHCPESSGESCFSSGQKERAAICRSTTLFSAFNHYYRMASDRPDDSAFSTFDRGC